MKTVLFVPGSGEDIHSRDYASTINAIEKKGYKVKFVDITWPRTIPEKWAAELNAVYAQYDPKDTILAGFSFGAVTAFLSAVKRTPSQLWLFSLSPYFAEDINGETMKPTWLKQLGRRRVASFSKLHFGKLLDKISSKTIFFYGNLELPNWPDISYRTTAVKRSKNSTVKIVKGAGHDVTHPNYIKAIAELIH